MNDFGVTAICCTPSYFLHLLDRAAEMGVDMRELPLRVGIFGAEPGPTPCGTTSRQAAGIQAFDIYGLSEIIGPGRGRRMPLPERPAHLRGPFLPRDHRPRQRPAAARRRRGRTGADHAQQAGHADDPLPHARYHSLITPSRARAGGRIRRIRRIARRSDDMFIIRGVNVFPSQIEAALLAVEGTLPHYQIVLTRQRAWTRWKCRSR